MISETNLGQRIPTLQDCLPDILLEPSWSHRPARAAVVTTLKPSEQHP